MPGTDHGQGTGAGYPGRACGAGLAPRSRWYWNERASGPHCPLFPSKPWRKMPKRVRPYGSAEDAEAAGLGSRLRTGGEGASEPGSTMTMRDIAGQAADAVRVLGELACDGT